MKRIGRFGPEHEKGSCSATQSVIVFISRHTRNVGGDEWKVRSGGLNAWDSKHVAILFRTFPHCTLRAPRDRLRPSSLALSGFYPASSLRFSRPSDRVSTPFREKLQLGQSCSGNCCFEFFQAFIGFAYST
jgi:hypothetical protein